jgi:cell division septum initiation protein DivIVA
MKGKPIKKFADFNRTDRFFSVVELDMSEMGDDGLVDIEMLRVGNFKHKRYGELNITHEMLDEMIGNFENNVVGRDISFDWNHKAENASGWLKSVRIEDGKLIGTTEFTEKGKDSVAKKDYGYFSIEYSDNYVDPETEEEYGPTILGGALTNRPFMTKLKKIEFSEEGSSDAIYFFQEEKNMSKEDVKRTPVPKEGDQDPVAPDVTKLQEENEDLKKKLEELENKGKGGDKKLEEFIQAQTKQMESMTTQIKALEEANKKLADHATTQASKARIIEIERICDKLLADEHHHPAVVGVAKEILLTAPEDKVVKLTEVTGEGDDKKEVQLDFTFQEALLKLLSAVPKTQRANLKEETVIEAEKITEAEQKKLEDEAIARAMSRSKMKVVK